MAREYPPVGAVSPLLLVSNLRRRVDMSHSTERNLLVGFLAFQNELVTRKEVLDALKTWISDKSRSLEQILLSQGALTESQRKHLEQAVAEHLETHAGEAAAGLGSLQAATTLHQDLASLADRDLLATLACFTAEGTTRADAAARPAEPSATQPAGRFRVLREHARGGLGKVQVAVDEELQREVALKEIQSRFASDESLRRRFVLEAEVTGRLEHPGVVPVYGLGAYADG